MTREHPIDPQMTRNTQKEQCAPKKNLYGRKAMGIERSTFLIDPTGVIAQSWRPVKVAGHAQAVLDALQAMSGATSAPSAATTQ